MVNHSAIKRGKRKNIRQPFRYVIEAFFAYILYSIFWLLPLPIASWLGGQLGHLVYYLSSTSKTARKNLHICLPQKSEKEREVILKNMWIHFGRVIAEVPHVKKFASPQYTTLEGKGLTLLKEHLKQNKPTILVSAHIGSLGTLASICRRLQIPITSVYRLPNNPLTDFLSRQILGTYPEHTLVPKGAASGKTLIETLKKNGTLFMAVDQKMNDGIPLKFFGQQAMTAPAAARLALKFNAALFPIHTIRAQGLNYKLIVDLPLTLSKGQDNHKATEQTMQKVNDTMEKWIKETPDQWMWMHKRW